jgi:cation diffusion facilitator CzcD-associated flavoprotein CzcO
MDFREGFYDAVADGSSELAGAIREQCKTMMRAQLPDRSDLWEALTPTYNPGCKRVIISDDFYPAIANSKVHLETRPIQNIGASSVEVGKEVSESLEDFDLLVCATGFKTVQFMAPIQLTGKNGRELKDVWKDGAQAYNGTVVQDMPNFGLLYGPNTNLVRGLSSKVRHKICHSLVVLTTSRRATTASSS